MGWESWSTEHQGGSCVPSQQIFMPRSILADRLHDTWRDTSEQTGSSMWLGLGFTFHPTTFSIHVTNPFQPKPSEISPENSNLPVLPPPPLPSELTPEENSLHGLPSLRTYSKLPRSSTHIETPLPIHIESPATSSEFSVWKPKPPAANIFFSGRYLFSLSLDASDEEFRSFNDQNSALKPRARHSLWKELNLAM